MHYDVTKNFEPTKIPVWPSPPPLFSPDWGKKGGSVEVISPDFFPEVFFACLELFSLELKFPRIIFPEPKIKIPKIIIS